MKTFLNWIMLFCMVLGALGVSSMAQDVAVVAQAEEPPPVGESQEPLILPFVPDESAESALQLPVEDPAITEPPAPAPFSIELDIYCDAWGQTARLSWSLTGELADSLGDKSELLVKLPAGLQPLEGMEIAPDGMLHLPASLEGQAVFSIQSEASETGWLDASLVTADTEQAATRVEFTPGAYARLTADGGRVDAKAMGISVDFPEKVLLAETAICIGPVTEVELPTSLSGRPFQLNAYDLEKGEEITKFEQDLKVQVSYGAERYSGKESQLMLFYYNRELLDWAALPTEVDEESNTLTGYTDHFTPFDFKTQSWESARLPTLDGFAVSNFTGAATYSYPIQLPPGAGGWQPSLALIYNSQVVDNANSMTQASWVGMGWSLDTGYIQRNMGDNISYYGPQDPYGDDADIRLDNDSGHDGDDTFSLVLNGQSWRLLRLPDQDSNTETIEYRTENESFWRIRHNHAHIIEGYVTDNSTWEVWDKTGNKYTFSPLARYPIGCNSPFMLAWQWPLTLAQTAMDLENPNVDYSITYTYAYDQEARRDGGLECAGAFTQVAVFPATISYSGYQVVFDLSDLEHYPRLDHKATWDTYPTKEIEKIFFEQSRLTDSHPHLEPERQQLGIGAEI